MIQAFNDLWNVYRNALVAKTMDGENTAWNVIALHIAQAVSSFNEKVIEFYVLNIR